jgi:predicted metal-dependent peptidase
MATLSPREKLAAAIMRVVEPPVAMAPYFNAVLRGLVRREAPGLSTIGVTKDGVMLWDPAFVERTDMVELASVLVHEVMHVVLKHHDRSAALGIVAASTADQAADAYIANIAMDCAINTELGKGVKLPAGACMPENFDMPPNKTFEEYYALLQKQRQEQQQEQQKNQSSGGSSEGTPDGTPGAARGWCGSCAGHPVPGEPEGGGASPDGRSEADMERYRKQVAQDIQGVKDRGTVPAALNRWADAFLKPAKIDWRTKLARIVRGTLAYKAGQSDFTWSRISRRQAGVGFGVGRPVIPAMHAPKPSAAVGVDTSGSMSPKDLSMALSEIQGVLAAVGSGVTVLTCDAVVHEVKDVSTAQEAAALLKGGGGTSMTPIFDELEKRREKPSVTIIVTDGHIGDGYPVVEPSWTKTIWCVVGRRGNVECCPWGEIVHAMDDED